MMQARRRLYQLPHIAGPSDVGLTGESPIQGLEPLSFDFGFELEDEAIPSPNPKDQQGNSGHREPSTNRNPIHRDADLDKIPALFRPSLRFVPE